MSDTGYILNGITPIAVNYDTCREWAITVPLTNRRVAFDEVGDYDVSTVFLTYADDPERLFETMVFKAGTFSGVWCVHAATWDEALQAHKRGCEEARRLTLKGARHGQQQSTGQIEGEGKMSVWGEPDDFGPPEGYVTEERAEQAFVAGAQACREMLARFVEQGGHHDIAASIRANWHPGWGNDPGRPDQVADGLW